MFNDCILYNVKNLERKLTKIAEDEFDEIGLHHTYGYILTVIGSKDYVKTKQISKELCLDSSTVTRMVKKLENEGYVQKGSKNSPVDISLTTKGKALIPDIHKAWDNYHFKCEQLLGDEQITLINTLKSSVDKLK